ncbi:MAG: HXXEE domain-containing protein [Planctomycetota bacterium]
MLACLLTAAYLVHQIEEHWVDLLGRRYPLYEILNELLAGAFGAAADGAMTPAAIFFVNTTLVWLTGFLSIWRGGGFAVDALAGVVTVNGIAHIVQALATGTYNPGLATALSLFAPLAFAAARGRRAASATTARRLGLGALWGLAAHALLVAGVVASNVHGVVPTTAFYAVLATWGALPALIGQYASERDPAPLSQVE